MARPFRWTYMLLEGERWRDSIGDSPRFSLQRRLERGTVEAVRPCASERSGDTPWLAPTRHLATGCVPGEAKVSTA
jgi:hypothetical protein